MTSKHDKPKRWRPWQFRVSSLLLVTALVAVAVGWWLDHQRLLVELHTAEVMAKQWEALNVVERASKQVELARKQKELFDIRVELRSKNAEAEVYRRTIAELSKKLKAQ